MSSVLRSLTLVSCGTCPLAMSSPIRSTSASFSMPYGIDVIRTAFGSLGMRLVGARAA